MSNSIVLNEMEAEMQNQTKKIKVVAYCRVSTGSDEQNNSLKNQHSYFEREISKIKGNELYHIYADRGVSGTSLNKRDEFNRMLFDAGLDATKINENKTVFTASKREPLFHIIYVKNSSRFARNVSAIDILRELLIKNVYVYFLDINLLFDSNKKEFTLNLFLNFDQQESIDKSVKVRFGHAESARKGIIMTNGNIYGYRYLRDANKLEIIEEEAKVVRKVFELYSQGYGIRRILNWLEENKIKTRKGKSFMPSFIKKMLDQEKYFGTLVRYKYDTGVVFNKITPKLTETDKRLVHENHERIPAIITKELFEKCKAIRSGKISHVNQRGIHRGRSDFAGKIYCGICGNTYTRNMDRGRVFYNCSTKKTKGVMACDSVNVQEIDILAQLEDIRTNGLISVFLSQKEMQEAAFRAQIKSLKDRIDNPTEEELNTKVSQMAELDEEEERLVQLFVKGIFKETQLDNMKRDIDERRETLKSEINELSKTNEDIITQIKIIEERISKLNELTVKDEYSHEEILNLISKFIVSDKIVEYITKKEKKQSSRREAVVTYEFTVFEDLSHI
ncbi:recombinase family protein [Paenibacillus sp. ATY16]|uniref:recombinase family protein n=1 Tax=Paenibacillus sp. ATY16 TaxID=1759312 RepID=UPI00200CE654|nr:recombinase family protein [Paenibacillus sp. ATY16]MCK9858192.1 recombinase family protein [Paenibacillus sp. ATY16]